MSIGYTIIDNYIWKVQLYLMKKYGCDEAERDMDPLKWYIRSGRATITELYSLLEAKPFMVGRLLHEGGSWQEAIDRVLIYIQ